MTADQFTVAGPTLGVGAIVVKDGALLMVQRGKDPGRGLWTVPGGRLEHGELIADAVAREVREETGLEVEVLGLLGVFELPGDTHYVILDHIAALTGDDEPVAGDDAAAVRWVPFGEIDDLETTPRLTRALRAWGVFDLDALG
jgi:ADP-ribose pyrophosphatase YjhB (NUDIX family)